MTGMTQQGKGSIPMSTALEVVTLQLGHHAGDCKHPEYNQNKSLIFFTAFLKHNDYIRYKQSIRNIHKHANDTSDTVK